jgi:hypothetical protein
MKSPKQRSDLKILWKIAVGYIIAIILLNNIDISDFVNDDGSRVTEDIFAITIAAASIITLIWPFHYFIHNLRRKKDTAVIAMLYIMAVGYGAVLMEVIYVKAVTCTPDTSYVWYCNVAYSDIGYQLLYVPVLASLFGALWMFVRWVTNFVSEE